MIEVAPETACMLYLGLTVLALLFLWYRTTRKAKDTVTHISDRIICEFCRSAYVDDPQKGLTRCPHCQFLNKHLDT